jgi:lipopolysaccharide/colanic/teichoic acid biosynthesis glycosyltransferase
MSAARGHGLHAVSCIHLPTTRRRALRLPRRRPELRIAVVGSARCAAGLVSELQMAQLDECVVVGRIATGEEPRFQIGDVRLLGGPGQLGEIVAEQRIGLLELGEDVPALSIFDEALATCMQRDLRVCSVGYFYEAVFGHVRIAEINASWFHCIMHPRYRAFSPYKLAMDVAGALVLGLLFLPLLLLLALLIKVDGGPVFYKQVRIGERGRPFVIYKLRTMRVATGGESPWTFPDDPRVTLIGRMLRRSHIDELPQLINVLRGEMSLVGPRPEQPTYVSRLETTLPHYQRRHLIRPGITGWAQIRCGYAGSEAGSAWKLCHDLYYMKYRSLRLDLAILLRTIWGTFFGLEFSQRPNTLDLLELGVLGTPGAPALRATRSEGLPAADGAQPAPLPVLATVPRPEDGAA